MDGEDLTASLAAMGHAARYGALRLLVRAGEEGVSAGDLASQLEVAASAMSFHMSALSKCRLVTSERRGKSIVYRANMKSLGELIATLHRDLDEPFR